MGQRWTAGLGKGGMTIRKGDEIRGVEGRRPTSGAWDDETAMWYAQKWGDHHSNAMTVGLAELHPGDVVLDVGCGTGTALRAAAQVVTEGRVIGIDPTPAMLRLAEEQSAGAAEWERIEFLEGGAECIPLPDASVTVVLAINSIHHWQDWPRGLAEVKRVLAPGGRLWITEEALAGGKFGHGSGPLSDPQYVARCLREIGLVRAAVGTHERGAGRVAYVRAEKEG
jgi:SAM-dependent methyltransferase